MVRLFTPDFNLLRLKPQKIEDDFKIPCQNIFFFLQHCFNPFTRRLGWFFESWLGLQELGYFLCSIAGGGDVDGAFFFLLWAVSWQSLV